MTTKRHRSQAGFALIEVMIAAVILGILAVTSTSLWAQFYKTSDRAVIMAMLQNYRERIVENIRKPTSWKNTVDDPPNYTATASPALKCLHFETDCSTMFGQGSNLFPFYNLRGSSPSDLIWSSLRDETDPATDTNRRGFDTNGKTCFTFSRARPGDPPADDKCPFRYSLEWKPICPQGSVSCIRPDVVVVGTLFVGYTSQAKFGFINPENYKFQVNRQDTLDFRGNECPPNSQLMGVKPDGELLCMMRNCRQDISNTTTNFATASCQLDEFLVTGGGDCAPGFALRKSAPLIGARSPGGPFEHWDVVCQPTSQVDDLLPVYLVDDYTDPDGNRIQKPNPLGQNLPDSCVAPFCYPWVNKFFVRTSGSSTGSGGSGSTARALCCKNEIVVPQQPSP